MASTRKTSLANAPFGVSDPNLVPAAGPCSTCPKRSGSNPLLFADSILRKDAPTANASTRKSPPRSSFASSNRKKPVKVSDSFLYYGHKALAGVLYPSDYHEAQAAGECPAITAAVVVEGKQAGRKLYVCTNRKCPTHAARSLGLSPE